MEIKLKDLVWKGIDKEEELKKLHGKWRAFADTNTLILNFDKIFFENAEQIAKEKQEIINRPIEYTKQDIIDMFIEAGFEYDNNNDDMIFIVGNCILKVCLSKYKELLWFATEYINYGKTDDVSESIVICFSDRKRIDFYYKQFRNILEFEIENDN